MAAKAQYVLKDRHDFAFAKARVYRKTATLVKANVEIARKAQTVVTRIARIAETKNRASVGDRIVTGPRGERYVLTAEKFRALYQRDPHDPARYISKGRVHAIKVRQNIELIAPWGEKQRTKKGGYVVQRVGKARDVYLIEERAFKATYAPERKQRPPSVNKRG